MPSVFAFPRFDRSTRFSWYVRLLCDRFLQSGGESKVKEEEGEEEGEGKRFDVNRPT